LDRFSKLAKENNTYIVCPLATQKDGKNFNSAVLINRIGNVQGIYRKIHPTISEMEAGFSPGETDPPVFKTDFGMIGIQICFDMRWDDGWNRLKEKGAEIIFWPSAFPGGKLINAMALQHQVIVASSTLKDPARICDITGEELSKTGRWQKYWTCSTVNLEKVGLHAWPYVRMFDDIQKKYGPKIHIHYLHEEGHAVIESRSADVFVKDILEEFEIKPFFEHIQNADKAQKQAQKSGVESIKIQ
jgi:predicted amidohydrolase